MESEFPTNSKAPKTSKDEKVDKKAVEPKKIERVTQDDVIRRKKPYTTKFKETFLSGWGFKSAISFVTLDVLAPAAKDAIADAVSQGVERMIFGESKSSSRRGGNRYGGSNNHTNYQASFRSNNQREDPRNNPSRKSRAQFDFDEIIIPTRGEAEEVIDQLFEIQSKYEVATVADLYGLVGVTANYTDERWGWVDLRGAGPTRIRNGYLLDLPKPELLD
jgi:hypothetical protein